MEVGWNSKQTGEGRTCPSYQLPCFLLTAMDWRRWALASTSSRASFAAGVERRDATCLYSLKKMALQHQNLTEQLKFNHSLNTHLRVTDNFQRFIERFLCFRRFPAPAQAGAVPPSRNGISTTTKEVKLFLGDVRLGNEARRRRGPSDLTVPSPSPHRFSCHSNLLLHNFDVDRRAQNGNYSTEQNYW